MREGGSVPELVVVAESIEVVVSGDVADVLDPLRGLVVPDEGKPGIPGTVAEPVSGDLFRICSS